VLLYNDSDKSEGGFNDYNSDFKNELNLEEEEKLNLIEDILLFKDNKVNSKSNDSFFVNINKYL
jgi:hypothetical protein